MARSKQAETVLVSHSFKRRTELELIRYFGRRNTNAKNPFEDITIVEKPTGKHPERCYFDILEGREKHVVTYDKKALIRLLWGFMEWDSATCMYQVDIANKESTWAEIDMFLFQKGLSQAARNLMREEIRHV